MAAAVFFHALPRLKPWIVAGLQPLFCRAISCNSLVICLRCRCKKKLYLFILIIAGSVQGVHNFIIFYWVKLGNKTVIIRYELLYIAD